MSDDPRPTTGDDRHGRRPAHAEDAEVVEGPETGSTEEDPAVARTGPPPGGTDPMAGEAPSG